MELLIQKILRSGATAEDLMNNHGVILKSSYNKKIILTYDQIEAKDNDPVVQECRGLILDDSSFDIVAFPFKRFFNYGQQAAANIDWNSAKILEKLDGSLITCYWDKNQNKWCAATRGMAEAQSEGNFGFTFNKLVELTCNDMGFDSLQHLLAPAPKDHTLMFELTSPENKVVCQYDDRKLSLIGVRNLNNLEEILPNDLAKELNVNVPRTWQFNSLETLKEAINDWDPRDFEGVVVRDAFFSRIKVKSPKYLVAHHAIDSLGASWKSVVEAVAAGHTDDLEGLLPPFVEKRISIAKEKLQEIRNEILADWKELSHIEDKKEFALAAQKKNYPSGLFAFKNGKIKSIDEFFKNAKPGHLMTMCGFNNKDT